ncbi:MAG TPA: hypothetical protein VNJ51_10350 [Candidatus Dormibacteraeota bacterium]|nr:hypothetical protein [Candidatus Dormibacteraeota bacterium]
MILAKEHSNTIMLITIALFALIAVLIIGSGHPVDSRLDVREDPFFPAKIVAGLPARDLAFEAVPAQENELRSRGARRNGLPALHFRSAAQA